MKRSIILLSLMAGLAFSGFAQRDTVGAGYPFYFPTPIDFDTLPQEYNGMPLVYPAMPFFENVDNNMYYIFYCDDMYTDTDYYPGKYTCEGVAFENVPDSVINIIGIAYGFRWVAPLSVPHPRGDTTRHVATLYRPEGDNLIPVDSVVDVVVSDSTIGQHQFDHDFSCMFNDTSLLKYYDVGQCNRDYYINYRGIPEGQTYYEITDWGVKEFYFQHEITLSQGDTFYISDKWHSQIHGSDISLTMYYHTQYKKIYPQYLPIVLPAVEGRGLDTTGTWRHIHCKAGVPLIWAIIRRDCDSCPQVQGLQMLRSSATKAFFRWNQGVNHHDWQLSYGPAGTAPEDGTIVDCSHISSGLIEFDPDSHYVVYVRARCKFARYEYGPWSSPLVFSINGGVVGIDEAEVQDVTLSPNPAADRVTVGCGAAMRHVSVFNAAGVQVYGEAVEGGTTTIDLKGWPAGQYVVKVETAAGTASKVLTVAR